MIRCVRNEAAPRVGSRLFLAAGLPAFVLYLSTLAPTVSSEDSGELITSAYTLGIAHPPGYPLWCLLGKLFTFIPLGTVAWRVNLLSAVLGAAAVGVLALLAFRFTRSFFVSLIAALLFAGSRDFWSQCVIAEVYSLNILLFLLLLFVLFRFEDTIRTRWLYLASFILGLGLTNHSTLGPLAPVFFGWIFLRHFYLLRHPVLLLNLGASFLLGFAIVLYLPIRSAADPVMDWGNPETISATIDHLLRRQYLTTEEPQPRTLLGQGVLVLRFLETFASQFTAPIAALGFLGALENLRKERKTFWLLSILFALTSYGFIWLINYRPDRESLYLVRVLFLPAHAIGAIWIAVALKTLADRVQALYPDSSSRPALAWLSSALVLISPCFNFKSVDRSQDYLAEDWGRNILESLKPDSIILPSADHSTFPLLYLQTVEGVRGDVVIADKYGYIEDRVFQDLFRQKSTPRVPPPLDGSRQDKERYLIEHSGRPVYMTTKARISDLEGYKLETAGLVFEALPTGIPAKEEEHQKLWEGFQWRPGSLNRLPGEFSSDLVLSDYHYARGRHALLFSRDQEAIGELHRAQAYGFGIREIHNNLGGTLAEGGKAEVAIPFLKNALRVDPGYDMAIQNLGSALFSLKRYQEGLPYFEAMAKVDPESPLPHLGKARAHKERGEPLSAFLSYLPVLRNDPHSDVLRSEVEGMAAEAFGKDSPLIALIPPKPETRRPPDMEGEEFPSHRPLATNPEPPWKLPQTVDPLSLIK